MLTRRQTEILIDFYNTQEHPIKPVLIAEKYGVSLRTIQNDITIIRGIVADQAMELSVMNMKGYCLHVSDAQKSKKYIDEITKKYLQNYYFDDPLSRVKYILTCFLNHDDYRKSEDLADEMFISRSRISADLVSVKEILKRYDLKFISKPYYGLRIEGAEMDKRRCLIKENLNFKNEYTGFSASEVDQSYLLMNQIKEILMQIMLEGHYKISDIALQNLIIHIATAVERIRSNEIVSINQMELDETYHHVYQMAKNIMEQCMSMFSIPYHEGEVILLALSLHGKREYDEENYITDEINDIIYRGLMQIKKIYCIDLSNDLNLRISLGLHIIPLISRLKTNMFLKNIMTYNIKQNYTLAFDMASTFVNRIPLLNNEKLSDDEIAYIALHFSYSLDGVSNPMDAKSILLISSQKKSNTILIQQKIIQWFPNVKEITVIAKAVIVRTDFAAYNAVITTENEVALEYPQVILINYFLTETDYQKIELVLHGFTTVKDIIDKFDKALFINQQLTSKQDVIDALYEKAQQKGVADEELYHSILLHETIASSYFGNHLAILHPERLFSNDTFIAVAMLDQSIDWDGDEVNLIFLVSIEQHNPAAYKLWYYLSFLISNQSALQEMIKTPTYENLIQVVQHVYKDLF